MILAKREHFRTAFHGVDFHRAGGRQCAVRFGVGTPVKLLECHDICK